MHKRKLKDFVGSRPRARRVRRFVEDNLNFTNNEESSAEHEEHNVVCDKTFDVENCDTSEYEIVESDNSNSRDECVNSSESVSEPEVELDDISMGDVEEAAE
ncbi:hypothetical protein OUZ56_011413 [Daphnia magna]|uniref:Uncharacterized protein n=1 Tax=Daphnia magna TaxID=35525 RepID=A0ABQ9Z017_9CRUS|nr:hypothetical protein OUZ56_011413 [Daphnia magna]